MRKLSWLPILIKLHDQGCTSIAICFNGLLLKHIFFSVNKSSSFINNPFEISVDKDIASYLETEARRIMHPYLGEDKKSWESVVLINTSKGTWNFMFMMAPNSWNGKLDL